MKQLKAKTKKRMIKMPCRLGWLSLGQGAWMRRKLIHSCVLCGFLFFVGCVHIPPDNIVAAKATVFGLDVSSDPVTQTPHFRLGLVRYFYQRVPTSTNAVHAAPYSSDVDATASITSSHATESFTTQP